jgi:hypothetical protein
MIPVFYQDIKAVLGASIFKTLRIPQRALQQGPLKPLDVMPRSTIARGSTLEVLDEPALKLRGNQPLIRTREGLLVAVATIPILRNMTPILWMKFITTTTATTFSTLARILNSSRIIRAKFKVSSVTGFYRAIH